MTNPELPNSEPPNANQPRFWKRAHSIVVIIEPWGILLAVIALVLTLAQFWTDYQDRVSERVVRAWTLVTTAAPGNSGKREALEYLNREDGWLCVEWLWEGCAIVLKPRTELVGIDLSASRHGETGAYLPRINLRRANLIEADLSGANLFEANLFHAFLVRANLSNTNLVKADLTWAQLFAAQLSEANLKEAKLTRAQVSGADLSKANLSGVNLSRANLARSNFSGANFSGASLSGANLSLANLSEARKLSQDMLDEACAFPDHPPLLPKHLTWNTSPCPASRP